MPKSKIITVRLDITLLEAIKALAEAEDRSLNKTICRLLERFMTEKEGQAPTES